jgi:diguanylate cyclase (GGDEF)-like protein
MEGTAAGMATDETPTIRRLRGLLDVTQLVRSDDGLEHLLAEIARTISESLGLGTVAVNVYRPAWDDFEVTVVYGNEGAREALLGAAQAWSVWEPLLAERFRRRGAYFIGHGEFDWDAEGVRSFVPDLETSDDPEAWHPEDALVVPLARADGQLLGILSVDEPQSGRIPSDEQLDVLVAIAEHAAIALHAAQERASAARTQAALEQLLNVSSLLSETRPVESILQSVCDGIRSALGFQTVAIELVDEESGEVRQMARTSPLSRRPRTRAVSAAELESLLDPAFEMGGCFLLPADEVDRRLAAPARRGSARNGRGPHAWADHWLLVPLFEQGRVRGFIRADDPGDCLLPSADRLQALRLFANQASTALASAAEFERIRFLADHDPLTGLLNRRAFARELEAELVRADRHGHEFALVLGDLDRFKALNDRHGHLAGDEALQQVAAGLRRALRRSDRAFRIGGDEFALILPELTQGGLEAALKRISVAVQSGLDGSFADLHGSFGAALFPHAGRSTDELIGSADEALYRAKLEHGVASDDGDPEPSDSQARG